jgi:murein DD-endopeptidase MepM/ murein hydrolase activator NlpD
VSCRRRRARRMLGVGLLVPGLLLAPPPGQAADPPAKPPTKRVDPKPRTAERRAGAGPADAEPCVHVVRSGDSVSRLAARYHVPRQRIIDVNHLTQPDALRVGQRLGIPGCDRGRAEVALAAPLPQPDGSVLALVGPRRIPTRFFMGVPEFADQAVEFVWPVMGAVMSGMGPRRRVWHAGIDIRAEIGTPVYAAAPGSVYFSGSARGYGQVVKIEHTNGFMSIYAHNLQNLVNAGDRVEAGTVIATVGRSGRAAANHLHFEIRRDGLVYNPLFLLPRRDAVLARADEMQEAPDEDDEDE